MVPSQSNLSNQKGLARTESKPSRKMSQAQLRDVKSKLREVESQYSILKSASQIVSVAEQVKGTYNAHFKGNSQATERLPIGNVNKNVKTLIPADSI